MILTFLVSLLAVAGFGVGLWRLQIAAVAQRAIASATAALSSILDKDLDDAAKEQALRRSGVALLGSGWNIAWRFAAALALAALPVVLADLSGLVEADAVLALMLRLDYILIVSVVAIVLVGLLRRRGGQAEAAQTQYSGVDRFFHVLAFSSPKVLKAAARWEDRVIRDTAPADPDPRPIFVTSLARGGTTALLNALHNVPEIATHTYRDMPFLTAPRLWRRLSGGDRRQVARRERAHGDGLEIDLDSPEAFEEAIWQILWPEHFRGPGIDLWRAGDARPEAEHFLRDHMHKIVRARDTEAPEGPRKLRYCSKNNGNVARLDYLPKAFPDCRIVVPIRRPESHAASLLRQHRNFCQQQADDEFVRRYMRDIGHFEFGLIHKPVLFEGFDPAQYDPNTPDYWLAYWIHAFRDVATHAADCILVTQEDLRDRPVQTMTALCQALEVDPGATDFTTYFRPGADTAPTDVFTPALYREAEALFETLQSRALRGAPTAG